MWRPHMANVLQESIILCQTKQHPIVVVSFCCSMSRQDVGTCVNTLDIKFILLSISALATKSIDEITIYFYAIISTLN